MLQTKQYLQGSAGWRRLWCGPASYLKFRFLSVDNFYLDFLGQWEYQVIGQMKVEGILQPELTRNRATAGTELAGDWLGGAIGYGGY